MKGQKRLQVPFSFQGAREEIMEIAFSLFWKPWKGLEIMEMAFSFVP